MKKKLNLSLLGQPEWYLGMKIKQTKESYTHPDIADIVHKLAKFSNSPDIIHYREMIYLIDHIKNSSSNHLKFLSNLEESPIYKVLVKNRIEIDEDTVIIFTNSL